MTLRGRRAHTNVEALLSCMRRIRSVQARVDCGGAITDRSGCLAVTSRGPLNDCTFRLARCIPPRPRPFRAALVRAIQLRSQHRYAAWRSGRRSKNKGSQGPHSVAVRPLAGRMPKPASHALQIKRRRPQALAGQSKDRIRHRGRN